MKSFAVCINRWSINVYIYICIKLLGNDKKQSVLRFLSLYVATCIMNKKHWFSLDHCQNNESTVGIFFISTHLYLKDQR